MTVAHVFTGGERVSTRRILSLGKADLVIAADSGIDNALEAGLFVDVLVGDLDSITGRTLSYVEQGETRIEAHPWEKAATDLELALQTAVRSGVDEIVVVGGGGGRLDHLLGNVAVIASRALRAIPVRWEMERETVYVVHHRRTIPISAGSTFSLIPIAGDAAGVTLTGSKWETDGTKIEAGSSLGISNIALDNEIRIEVGKGTVLVVVPFGLTDP